MLQLIPPSNPTLLPLQTTSTATTTTITTITTEHMSPHQVTAQLQHTEGALAQAEAQCAGLQGANAQLNSEFKDLEALASEVMLLRDSTELHASELSSEKKENTDLKRLLAISKTDLQQALTAIETLSTTERCSKVRATAAEERCTQAEDDAALASGEAETMQQVCDGTHSHLDYFTALWICLSLRVLCTSSNTI